MGTKWASARPLKDAQSGGVSRLAEELTVVLRHGLPVTEDFRGDTLPTLRCIRARATRLERHSRLEAVSEVIDEELRFGLDPRILGLAGMVRFDRGQLMDAALVLFAARQEWEGRTLTDRRREAAEILGYEYHHFRKRIEPRIARALALAIHYQELKYLPASADELVPVSGLDIGEETSTSERETIHTYSPSSTSSDRISSL